MSLKESEIWAWDGKSSQQSVCKIMEMKKGKSGTAAIKVGWAQWWNKLQQAGASVTSSLKPQHHQIQIHKYKYTNKQINKYKKLQAGASLTSSLKPQHHQKGCTNTNTNTNSNTNATYEQMKILKLGIEESKWKCNYEHRKALRLPQVL